MRSFSFSGIGILAEQKTLELVHSETLPLDSAFPILLVRSPGGHGRIPRKRGAQRPRHWARLPFARPCPRPPAQTENGCVFSENSRLTDALFSVFSSLASPTSALGSSGGQEHSPWPYGQACGAGGAVSSLVPLQTWSFLNSLIQIPWKHWSFTWS